LLLSFTALAFAQGEPEAGDEAGGKSTTSDSNVEAKELLDKANTHFRAGEFREAADGFHRLLEHLGEDGWFLHYNLGLAYENLGVPTKAAHHYRAFVAAGEKPAAEDESLKARVQDAKERLAGLEKRFGQLEETPPEPTPPPAPTPQPLGSPEPEPPVLPPDAPSKNVEGEFPTLAVGLLGGLAVASIALPIALNLYTNGIRDDAAALGTDHPDYQAKYDDFNAARTGYYLSYGLPALFAVAGFGFVIDHAVGDGEEVTVKTDGRGFIVSGTF
jgi:tetratricopeptide (TPR) repeat protein